jgi:hypothetical protein
MASMTAPTDPRPQFTTLGLALTQAFGGGPSLDQFQQIGPDRYILNSWPRASAKGPVTSTTSRDFSPLVAQVPVEAGSKSSPQARAVWPNLR